MEPCTARELLAESVESRLPAWTARWAAFCTVCTVQSLGAWMTPAPWRLPQASSAGRSLSSWPRPGSRVLRRPRGRCPNAFFPPRVAWPLCPAVCERSSASTVPANCRSVAEESAVWRSHQPQRELGLRWRPHSRAMRRDAHDKHPRKVASIQYAREGLLWWRRGVGEGMAGALAAIAPGAFASRAVGIGPPRSDVLAPAPGTPQGTLLPPQRMEVGVTLLDLEEGVDIREHRHG